MVFHFPSPGSAQIFLHSAQTSLQSGKIVTSGAVPGIPGARRVTYFGATDEAGVGQAVSSRRWYRVVLLSFFSGSNGNPAPITQADATEIALAQERALRAATPGGPTVSGTTQSDSGGTYWLVFGVVAVLVLGLLLGGVVVRRHRRSSAGRPGSPAA